MRRALGLNDTPQARTAQPPSPPASNGPRPPRRFVRDGEVPVSVIHRDDAAGTNQLEAARSTIRSLTSAREHAERLLTEAQNTIRELQTRFAHERMAKEEMARQAEAERQASEQALLSLQAELADERANRHQIEEQLAAVSAQREEAEGRAVTVEAQPGRPAQLAGDVAPAAPPRRRGRPPKVREPEAAPEFVEWWRPGWKERLR
jgi:hypothetical protein